MLVNTYYKDKVVLCGDSAHAFPPAGGFGMNSGIEDAYELNSRINLIKTLQDSNIMEHVLSNYSKERMYSLN